MPKVSKWKQSDSVEFETINKRLIKNTCRRWSRCRRAARRLGAPIAPPHLRVAHRRHDLAGALALSEPSTRDLIPLPNKTKQNYKVFIYRLNNPDMDLFTFVDAVKTFFMLADTRLTEEDDIASGEVPIFDSANVSLKFISKVNLSVLRKYMLYTQEAIPIRLKQVHVINAPSYIGKLHAICKPFLKAEVAKLIKFHEPNSTTLYEDIPQELLPNEYGGKAGTVEQIKRYWLKRMEAKRDWFLSNDKRWQVEEALRPTGCADARTDKARDLPGSFRSLALD